MYSCQKQASVSNLGEAGTMKDLAALVKETGYFREKKGAVTETET